MSKRLHTIPQLDSVRCIAAFMVIFGHFAGFPFGIYGVDIFFVISGYLITAILLEQKDTELPRLFLVKNFMIKRVLRIFPVYYFMLIFWSCASFFGLFSWFKGDGIYYYTYTSNILFYLKGWRCTQLNHTWTLAIEEQFYIFWPWLILFLPKRKEFLLILLFVIFSLTFKLIFTDDKYNFLTIAHLDTLGIGALIAYMLKYNHTSLLDFLYKFRLAILLITAVVFVVDSNTTGTLSRAIHYLCLLIFPSTLVVGCYYSFKSYIGSFLNNRVIRYLGKISYGLYLYHLFVRYICSLIFTKIPYIHLPDFIIVTINVGLTIFMSYISYILIEKKFISLKAKFDI